MGEPLAIETEGVASRAEAVGKVWGPWATVGLGVLLVAVCTVVQVIAVVPIAGVRLLVTGVKTNYAVDQGWVLAWMTIVGAPVAVGATVLLVRLRKGPSVVAYLGLTWPRAVEAIRCFLVLLGLLAAMHLLSWALGRPLMPETMIAMYQKAGLPLVPALVVAAPLAEEFIFRGFLLPGLLGSRLGPTGAIGITALAFGSLHIQYDVYGFAAVVACGVLFGWVRWRTGSLWLCVLLHGFMNLVAAVEILLFV